MIPEKYKNSLLLDSSHFWGLVWDSGYPSSKKVRIITKIRGPECKAVNGGDVDYQRYFQGGIYSESVWERYESIKIHKTRPMTSEEFGRFIVDNKIVMCSKIATGEKGFYWNFIFMEPFDQYQYKCPKTGEWKKFPEVKE